MGTLAVRRSVPVPFALAVALEVALEIALTGCGGAASPASSVIPAPASPGATGTLALTSAAFADGAPIPARFTCDGADAAPPLAWQGAPARTAAFALLVTDPDAGGFAHWVVGPIPASLTALTEGMAPDALPQGANGFGSVGWRGPCPPTGSHHYVFTLGALPAGVRVDAPPTADGVRAALERALATGTLTATYARR